MGTRLFRMDPKAFKFKVKNHRDHKEQSFHVNLSFTRICIAFSVFRCQNQNPPACQIYFTPMSIAVFIPATMALTWIRSVAPMLRRCSIVARRSRIVILVCGESSRS